MKNRKMVIPPQARPERVTKFLKPYILRMHFTNKFVHAHRHGGFIRQSLEKSLRSSMEQAKESTRDVAAASKIGKILGERLLFQNIPAVSVYFKRDQKYHGKVKAVIDSLKESGIRLL